MCALICVSTFFKTCSLRTSRAGCWLSQEYTEQNQVSYTHLNIVLALAKCFMDNYFRQGCMHTLTDIKSLEKDVTHAYSVHVSNVQT